MDTPEPIVRAAPRGPAAPLRAAAARRGARPSARAERVVVVGGGAGGLELAVKLARRARRRDGLVVTLVDASPTHFWKPLLHEVATGSMNAHRDATSYAMLGARHGFDFVLGRALRVDARARELRLDAVRGTDGRELLPGRTLRWSRLVLAVGSESRDFGIPGVAEHAATSTRAPKPSGCTPTSSRGSTARTAVLTTPACCRSSSSAAGPPGSSSPPTCTACSRGCAPAACRRCAPSGCGSASSRPASASCPRCPTRSGGARARSSNGSASRCAPARA